MSVFVSPFLSFPIAYFTLTIFLLSFPINQFLPSFRSSPVLSSITITVFLTSHYLSPHFVSLHFNSLPSSPPPPLLSPLPHHLPSAMTHRYRCYVGSPAHTNTTFSVIQNEGGGRGLRGCGGGGGTTHHWQTPSPPMAPPNDREKGKEGKEQRGGRVIGRSGGRQSKWAPELILTLP